MEILKYDRKILRYIYSHRGVSFGKLRKHFKGNPDIPVIIRGMLSDGYIAVAAGVDKPTNVIPDSCILVIAGKGAAVVEENQWFDGQFVLLQIILPIVIAIITTLITIFLSAWLLPSR